MVPAQEILIFAIAALGLVITPGPNMIYLISRSLTQGKKAGVISLLGVICGFMFHILMVSLGLTVILFTVPYAYLTLKSLGVVYLLYLAFQAIKPNGKNIFEPDPHLKGIKSGELFRTGLLTSVLNPKVAVFYVSFFPQFIKPEYGSVLTQSLQLGITQVLVSSSVNLVIVMSASRVAVLFSKHPIWIRIQKWFMASILTGLAVKMALDKGK